jgi:hypothetical protein
LTSFKALNTQNTYEKSLIGFRFHQHPWVWYKLEHVNRTVYGKLRKKYGTEIRTAPYRTNIFNIRTSVWNWNPVELEWSPFQQKWVEWSGHGIKIKKLSGIGVELESMLVDWNGHGMKLNFKYSTKNIYCLKILVFSHTCIIN